MSIKWCILHHLASLDCCRCVFSGLCFCEFSHPFHRIQHPFACLKQPLFHSLPCILVHLAMLFHAKSMVKCRTLPSFFMQKPQLFAAFSACFVPKGGLKSAKWRPRCRHLPLTTQHNPTRECIICGRWANYAARRQP